jgi:hypothetical protein
MKTLKFLIFAVLALSMGMTCSKDDASEERQDLASLKLTGTKWKLADIRNIATGELRTLDSHRPNDYEKECFSFTFENDTLGYGRACVNGMLVNIKGTNGSYLGCMTEARDVTVDCRYFSDVLYLVDDCFFEKDLLIFAYTQDNVRYHLQFKQVMVSACAEKPETPPVSCGDCDPQPFLVTYAKVESDRNSYFIKGEVIEVVQHGNRIKIIEDFKKNYEDNTTITVWGDGGAGNRMDALYNSNVTDTLLLLITKTDLLENSLCPQCEPYEQLNDYMTMVCSYSVLKLSNGIVSGRITDAYEEITMLWADLSKQLEITK